MKQRVEAAKPPHRGHKRPALATLAPLGEGWVQGKGAEQAGEGEEGMEEAHAVCNACGGPDCAAPSKAVV